MTIQQQIAHSKLKHHIGERFGKLIVVARYYPDKPTDRMSRWECKCDCGRTTIVRMRNLKEGSVKSCGCLLRKSMYEQISGDFYYSIQRAARTRHREFSITKQYLWELFLKQGKRCALSGVPLSLEIRHGAAKTLNTASVDRIDSTKGYIEGNVQWVHKEVNVMKSNFPQEKFLKWVFEIYNFQPISTYPPGIFTPAPINIPVDSAGLD